MVFKNKKVLAMVALVTSFLGAKDIPIVEGKVKFDDDQTAKLKGEFSQESLDALLKAFNEEIAANGEVQGIKAQIDALLKEHGVTAEEVEQISTAAKEGDVAPGIKAIADLLASHDETIKKLVNSAEDDTPIAQMKEAINKKIKHSATHAFASGKEWDAFEGRPWNARIAGVKVGATDYSDSVTVEKLNGDAALYFRENPTELESLHRDLFGLPSFWPKRLKVDSTVVSGSILTAEITQGRKFGWLPKNNQVIEPEEGKIYPVQIDAEWDGAKLQEIEDSWLNFFNKEGSSPEKMTFVRFMVGEIMKQARVEDRESSIRGIYVKTPDGATVAGKMINRQNGLLYQLWKARDIDQKYRPFNVGMPTLANIKDYLDDPETGMIAKLPENVKNIQGLKLYMEKKYWDGYKAKFKDLNGQNLDYKGLPEHPENYPNIEVVPLIDMYSTGFMVFTLEKNIEILENIPAEKSAYRFQWILRKLHLMADYKLGLRLIHIGRKVNANDPEEFKVQSVWSNNAPIFPATIFAPVFDNKSGLLKPDFKNLQVDDEWATDITQVTGVVAGQIIKIRGNTSLSAAKAVKNNANILLTGSADFPLKGGGTLTLYINDNFKAVEISRTTAPDAAPNPDLTFNDPVIDANDGMVFKYDGTVDMTITGIVNGFDGQKITIYGNDTVDVDLKLVNGDKIAVGADVTLSAATHYVELVRVDGVWSKVKLVNT